MQKISGSLSYFSLLVVNQSSLRLVVRRFTPFAIHHHKVRVTPGRAHPTVSSQAESFCYYSPPVWRILVAPSRPVDSDQRSRLVLRTSLTLKGNLPPRPRQALTQTSRRPHTLLTKQVIDHTGHQGIDLNDNRIGHRNQQQLRINDSHSSVRATSSRSLEGKGGGAHVSQLGWVELGWVELSGVVTLEVKLSKKSADQLPEYRPPRSPHYYWPQTPFLQRLRTQQRYCT